jgi:hypothetical protein
MVRAALPIGVLKVVVTVAVALPPAATETGLKDAPAGNPLAVKLIEPVKPLSALVLIE